MCSRLGLVGFVKASMVLAFSLALISSSAVHAAGPVKVVRGEHAARKIHLQVGKSVIVRSGAPVVRTTLGSPDVADIVALSPTQIYITGKATGVTNLTLWQSDDKVSAIYDIEVAPDTMRLKEKLHEILPGERDIKVSASHDSLTLSGTISSSTHLAQAMTLAEAYSGGKKVINLLQVSGVHQVMLEVRVAEMSRSLTNRLGINSIWNVNGSMGASLLGNLATLDKFAGSASGSSSEFEFAPTVNSLFHILGGPFTWTAFIDALKEDGLVKVLAEPTLIAMSGQSASFLAGGEFPIPVPQGLGSVAIEYKQFGVSLAFTPTVLNDKRMNIIVAPEVSELDYTTAINIAGVAVPGLTTRKVSTAIELNDGQSFAIAGLLKDTVREAARKFPILGSVPVLGALFRSVSFQRNETELIVIVTPRLAKPIDVATQPLPTDKFIEPSDSEFFFLGLLQGRAQKPAPRAPLPITDRKAGFDGEFGHTVP